MRFGLRNICGIADAGLLPGIRAFPQRRLREKKPGGGELGFNPRFHPRRLGKFSRPRPLRRLRLA